MEGSSKGSPLAGIVGKEGGKEGEICGGNCNEKSSTHYFHFFRLSFSLPSFMLGDNRYGPVVAVSLDYRLNIFGFLALADLSAEQVGRERGRRRGRRGKRENDCIESLHSRHCFLPSLPASLFQI